MNTSVYPQPGVQVITTQPMVATTTVVTQQPMARGWSSGMCDCCNDIKSCCCAFWCGNCYYCCIATRMGENCCVGYSGYGSGCVPGGHMAMRSRFRATHGIEGDICSDCCAVSWCLPCVMCQLSREMDYHRYPPGSC